MWKPVGIVLLLLAMLGESAELSVASLHPLLSEMARRVGGEGVKVVDLFPSNGELHRFEPTAQQQAAAGGCRLVLACGKGVEPYLGALKEGMTARGARVLELGTVVPDVYAEGSPSPDPHWWNAPQNMKRAAFYLAMEMARELPAERDALIARFAEYAREMDELTREARLALTVIPQEERILVTEHAAMCHFCEAFGFKTLAVQGVAAESEGDMGSMAELIRKLRELRVRCIFVDVRESPRFLRNIAQHVGARTETLVMDGVTPGQPTYAEIFRANVRVISGGQRDGKPPAGNGDSPGQARRELNRKDP